MSGVLWVLVRVWKEVWRESEVFKGRSGRGEGQLPVREGAFVVSTVAPARSDRMELPRLGWSKLVLLKTLDDETC